MCPTLITLEEIAKGVKTLYIMTGDFHLKEFPGLWEGAYCNHGHSLGGGGGKGVDTILYECAGLT